jgi:uncharacterized protein YxeA
MKEALFGILAVLMLITSAIAWFEAPCEVYSFASFAHTPARCL